MQNEAPQIETQTTDGRMTLRLRGDWSSLNAADLETIAFYHYEQTTAVQIDLAGVRQLDSFGAWAIEKIRRTLQSKGATTNMIGVSPERADVLTQMSKAEFAVGMPPKRQFLDPIANLGSATQDALSYLFAVLSMIGRLVVQFIIGARRPKFLRGASVLHHVDRVGVKAVPIILMITFLIGVIIAQQGLFYFRKFGASDYVVNLVTVLVLRELGVLLVAIMLAGRSGSAYAAELGSMKMREEIDALRTMGLDPVDLLILPRVAALTVAAPLLTIIGVLSALIGAGAVLCFSGEMTPTIFLSRLHQAATYTDFEVGLIKAPVMALVVGVVAAIEGMKVKGSAESVGLGATSSVVKSIFLVIVMDGLFAVLFSTLGM